MSPTKPNITFKQGVSLVQRLYDLVDVVCLREFISYDNQNILIEAHQPGQQGCTDQKTKFTLKLTNSDDSQRVMLHTRINEVLLLMKETDVVCPLPVENVNGETLALEKISFKNKVTGEEQTGSFLVRLLSFVPGQCIGNVPLLTSKMCYEAGQLHGKLLRKMKGYQGDLSEFEKQNERYIWSLKNIPTLREDVYLDALQDDPQRTLVKEVVDAFEENVLKIEHKFTKGLIHGDFNDYNILVREQLGSQSNNECDKDVIGVLDFDDMMYTSVVYDIGVSIMYIMQCTNLERHPLESGGHFLAGVLSERRLDDAEWGALYYCIAARLVQSLVLGLYTYSLQPHNDYLLSSQVKGWEVLRSLWAEEVNDLLRRWKKIIKGYELIAH